MLRTVILVVGLTVGYFYGFRDARRHDRPVTARFVERLEDKARRFADDSEAQAELDGATPAPPRGARPASR